MSIVKQIYFGMGLLIAIILSVGVFAVYETNHVSKVFDEYRSTAKQSLLAADIMADVFEARLAYGKFRTTRDPKYIEEVRNNIDEVLALSDELDALSQSFSDAQVLLEIPTELTEYLATLEKAAELQLRRDALVQLTSDSGLKARQQLSEVMDTALKDNDAVASSAAGLAATRLLLGRLYLERFLVSNSSDDVVRSTAEIESARVGLKNLMFQLQDPRRRELTEATMADLDEFDAASAQVASVILERNAFYARMDEIGPLVLQHVETAVDAVVERQNTIGPAAVNSTQRIIWTLSVIVLVSTLIGAALAYITGRNVSVNLTKVTEAMSKLADGDLDTDIEPSQQNHEIGKMKNAMVVFLENARKARDLDLEVKRKEEIEKQQEVENLKRKAESEEAHRAKEEQERELEQQRMQTLEAFQQDMEQVLGKAALGDFTRRMPNTIQDPSLVALANVINQLLETTETNIGDIVQSIDDLAKGNLATRIEGDREGVFLQMKEDFNAAMVSLSQTMAQVMDSGRCVSDTSSELEAASLDMAKRSEDNAAAVVQTSATIEELSANVHQVVKNAKAAKVAAEKVKNSADGTSEISKDTEASINEMSTATGQINNVVKVIEDIAFQINLLALNAGVEAARAGDAGRGFSVVASEVRGLAQRSQEAVQEIGAVIEQNNRSVEIGVEKVVKTREALEGIVSDIETASAQIAEIAAAVEEQSVGIDEVNLAIRSIDTTTHKNAASLEELTASSMSLNGEAQTLSKSLDKFSGVSSDSKSQSTESVDDLHSNLQTEIFQPPSNSPEYKQVANGSPQPEADWEDF
ncbi:MAG: methyl-accepting chemotaxis protein [Paracoccaceae bacterium]